ncbi:MAG: leucyl aminopeptidase [Pseudomonadota bacterium]
MITEFIAGEATAALPDQTIAVLAFEDGSLCAHGRQLDAQLGGALTRAFNSRFRGKLESHAVVIAARPVFLIGAGTSAEELPVEEIAAYACQAADSVGSQELILRLPHASAGIAARAAFGARLGMYRFHRHRQFLRPAEQTVLRQLRIVADDVEAAHRASIRHEAVADGVLFARDLSSEPANVLNPVEFANRLRELERPQLQIEILGVQEMTRLGMGSLLSVGQGSAFESQLAILRWSGAPDPAAAPVAFVGKGVTFDSGGLSIKPASSMEDMKSDMGGAGAIAGLMLTLAQRRAPVNAVAVLGLVENMVDSHSTRPGDIVKSLSGRTIEVLNTDAEGRLVLADALWYCEERFSPRAMIDVATLTGAVMVALGTDYAGLYSEDDALAQALLAAGEAEKEPLWRMPMPESYDRHLRSDAADLRNIAAIRFGGASIAARFLRNFVRTTPWAHLDISSPTWRNPSGSPLAVAGATGFGVRVLNRFIEDHHEAPGRLE